MNEVSVLLAFIAGLCSFLSPCCLPLIPSYLSFIGGTGLENKNRLIVKTASFVLGFTAVFIVLSILLATTFSLNRNVNINKYINRAAGIIIIAMGINIFFGVTSMLKNIVQRKKSPEASFVCEGCEDAYDKRYKSKKSPQGIVGAFLVGAAFAVGWTPCVGPVLAGILFLAGQSGSLISAILYLFVYSMGLGLPFLCMAVFFEKASGFIVKTMKYKGLIQKVSGALLVGIGLLIFGGRFQALNIAIQKWQYRYIDWAAAGGLMVRLLPAGIALVITAAIISVTLLHKKAIFRLKTAIPCGIFTALALLQTIGLINSADILASWFLSLQKL
ncbi:MAG: cytochrome c biogenesis CcdA family protein [Treponema sp.]|jgi:cytochrome c-type biogenesis protein|nr:cytochrome c biogenesis CcdA family protein [Treponema sp.]